MRSGGARFADEVEPSTNHSDRVRYEFQAGEETDFLLRPWAPVIAYGASAHLGFFTHRRNQYSSVFSSRLMGIPSARDTS